MESPSNLRTKDLITKLQEFYNKHLLHKEELAKLYTEFEAIESSDLVFDKEYLLNNIEKSIEKIRENEVLYLQFYREFCKRNGIS